MIAVAAFVADPPLVHERVFPRLQPVDAVLVLLDPDRAAHGAAGAHARPAAKEPDPLLIEEVLVGQRADGAKIDDVAGEVVVQGEAGQRRRSPRPRRGRRPSTRRVPLTSAVNRTQRLQRMQRSTNKSTSPRSRRRLVKGSRSARAGVLPVPEMIVLQDALARLVADRAVDRMPQQQALLDHRPGLLHLLAVGRSRPSVGDREVARGDELRLHGDLAGLRVAGAGLDEAHAATADDGQSRRASSSGGSRPPPTAPPGSR